MRMITSAVFKFESLASASRVRVKLLVYIN